MRILAIDVGGTHVKVLASNEREPREFTSGRSMTPSRMVEHVKQLTKDWSYDVISMGYPGIVAHDKIVAEPKNLDRGWVSFNFQAAFDAPVKIVNDAAMQALGDYTGGRMLFLGFGTGLGTALIVDGTLIPMELGHLPYKKGRTYEDYVGVSGLERLGPKKWRKHALAVIELFRTALEPDHVVIGGGNARRLHRLPEGVRLCENANAFAGGFRMWKQADAVGIRGVK